MGSDPPPYTHTRTHRLGGAEGEGAFTHAHKTIPICLRRQTPLLGFLGSRSCMNMWKRNVSLLSTGHTCNSIYCSHVQEIHQTGPISNRREIQSMRDRGKSTPNSILYILLIALDCERRRRSHGAASCHSQKKGGFTLTFSMASPMSTKKAFSLGFWSPGITFPLQTPIPTPRFTPAAPSEEAGLVLPSREKSLFDFH